MFNPSTATILYDNTDRAVPLCKARTKQLSVQYDLSIGAMRVVNLFSRRATRTDSTAEQWGKGSSLDHPDWTGEENDSHIREQSHQAALTVVGWGPTLLQRHGAEWRAAQVEKVLCDPLCLDVNSHGHPYYAGPRGAAKTALAIRLSVARGTAIPAVPSSARAAEGSTGEDSASTEKSTSPTPSSGDVTLRLPSSS
jgi:hypothetical protein